MELDPNAPPEFGELQFELPIAPVSQQASRAAKDALVAHIRSVTAPLKYIFDSEVQIDIQWFIHERLRWETDTSPDVDNIIKPLLDGLCGPDGILVDDCQVQSIMSSWLNWHSDDQKLNIRIKCYPNHFMMKAGLYFVRFQNALCYPVPAEVVEKGGLETWLDVIEKALQTRDELEALTGGCYYPARYVLPFGFIHRSRLSQFHVQDLAEVRERLSKNGA